MQQVEAQEILSRKKRDFVPRRARWQNYKQESSENERNPRDPLLVNQFNVPFNDAKWNQQWYLQKKKANQKLSMRVEDAWAAGYTGKGITVRVFESREIMDTVKNPNKGILKLVRSRSSPLFPIFEFMVK